MTDDLLDERISKSAPPPPSRGPQFDGALRAMIADAGDIARAAQPRRRATAGFAAAAALALVVCGGGVAVAAGLVSWPSGFEDPDGSYAFTLPSGRACEVRLVIGESELTEDPTAEVDRSVDTETQDAVQQEVARWLRDGALDRDLDLSAAEAEVAAIYEQQEAVGMTILLAADGSLNDAAIAPGRPNADDARAFAVDRAVRTAMREHLTDEGFAENSWTFSSDGGVRCAAE